MLLGTIAGTVLSLLALSAPVPQDPGALPEVRVGIVADGLWVREGDLVELFKAEILALTHGEYDVVFAAEHTIVGNWEAPGVAAALSKLLANDQVDLVLCIGPISSNEAGRIDPLPKPVLAPFVIDPELQGMPLDRSTGASSRENLSYLRFPGDLVRDVTAFQELAAFERLTFILDARLARAIPALQANTQAVMQSMGLEADLIAAGDDLDEVVAGLHDGVQAVYLAPLLHLTPERFSALVAELNARNVPTFSLWGRPEVELGVLAGINPETTMFRIARRTALNLQRILQGEEPGTLGVELSKGGRLAINMRTARAIGVKPSFVLLTEAELIGETADQETRALSLSAAVFEAIEANLDLRAVQSFVDAGREDVVQATSALYPQLELSAAGVVIDDDRARASLGAQPERSLTASARLSQLLYSEDANARIAAQEHLQWARRYQRATVELDVTLEAGVSYLDVLRAKTLLRVQRNNLDLTRTNLELAQLREKVGTSGPAEVYRWQNQIANARRSVVEAEAGVSLAEVALNRVLSRPQEEEFSTVEADLDDPALFDIERMQPYIDNPWDFRTFRDFSVARGLRIAPELGELASSIAAQKRLLLASERAFWSPLVALQGSVSERLDEAGAGSGGGGPLAGVSPADDNDWTLALQASFPLYTGGAKSSARRQARHELIGLTMEYNAVVERIEQRIRSTMHAASASYAGIRLSREAADAAGKNLDVVQAAYSRGAVSILDLLDAQNASLVADESAASATYDFLIDLMEVSRATGEFSFFKSEQDREQWFTELDEYFDRHANGGNRR